LVVPADVIKVWNLKDGVYPIKDQLNLSTVTALKVENGVGSVAIKMAPSESFIFGF
jgi:hypothetical protein